MTYLTTPGMPRGCVFCEALSGSDDRTSLLLARRARAFLILNLYPYAAGHLMAVVNRHVGTLPEAAPDEATAEGRPTDTTPKTAKGTNPTVTADLSPPKGIELCARLRRGTNL